MFTRLTQTIVILVNQTILTELVANVIGEGAQ